MPATDASVRCYSRPGVQILPLLVALLAASAGCGATSPLDTSRMLTTEEIESSKPTAEKFLTAMLAGEGAKAHDLCSAACKTATSEADVQAIWAAIASSRGTVKSWSNQGHGWKEGAGGSLAILSYLLICDSGDATLHFVLEREGGTWLIQELNYQLGSQTARPPIEDSPARNNEI